MLDCVACKEKRNKLYYFTYFYIILYDFINCPAFVDIKHNLALRSRNRVNINRERRSLCLFLMFVSHSFAGTIFLVVVLDRLFFIWET